MLYVPDLCLLAVLGCFWRCSSIMEDEDFSFFEPTSARLVWNGHFLASPGQELQP